MTVFWMAVLSVFLTLLGIGIGYYLRFIISLGKKGSLELELKEMLVNAKSQIEKETEEAHKNNKKEREKLNLEIKEREDKIKHIEERLEKKEGFLDERQNKIDSEIEALKEKIVEIKNIKERADNLLLERQKELEKVAGLTPEKAKEEIIKEIEKKNKEDFESRIFKLEREGEEKLEQKAKEILASSIQRLANDLSSDIFTSYVDIENEDVKGKVIGKEGRNIRAFEQMSGVELLVDEAQNSIMLSSFDPFRRYIAKMALEELVKDGRIQPAKIEKTIEEAREKAKEIIKLEGDKAVHEAGVLGLPKEVIMVLGRLHFRTSYGQNVLRHSIEMAHLAGMIAKEIGANEFIARAGALLHDIGKAIDHEVSGTHVEIGIKILQKFGVSEEIIKAMRAHHNEYPYETLESRIVQTADAISGARPGARRDNVELFLRRLGDLENIANSFKGVQKSYCLQAGREIRVFVTPSEVSDLEAKEIARKIAKRVEDELKFPGEIRVIVIRETRIIEFAK